MGNLAKDDRQFKRVSLAHGELKIILKNESEKLIVLLY